MDRAATVRGTVAALSISGKRLSLVFPTPALADFGGDARIVPLLIAPGPAGRLDGIGGGQHISKGAAQAGQMPEDGVIAAILVGGHGLGLHRVAKLSDKQDLLGEP